MDIGFFMNYNDEIVQLPVNPEKVTVSYSGNNATKEIIKLGEINLLKDRKLSEIEFESFFPMHPWFPAVRTRGLFRGPDFYKEFIVGIQEDKKPFRLVITGLNISMKCSVENFEFYHQGGDHEDAYYSLSLKEYRDYHIAQIGSESAATENSNKKQPSADKAVSPSKITIGSTVILNGTVHYDSFGAKPGKTFKNYKGIVNFINKSGSHMYHVTTLSGGWLGWVTEDCVVLA